MTPNLNLSIALRAAHCSHCRWSIEALNCADAEKLFEQHCEHLECVTVSVFVWFNDNRDHFIIDLRLPWSPLDAVNN